MRKPNLIDMAFNDKAKSNTQNFIIGTLLTQFKSSKLNNEKQITEQLEAAPSIKDLKIAEQLKRLRDFNQKWGDDDDDDDDDDNNNNDDSFRRLPFELPLYNPPPPSISEDHYDEIEKDVTPAQKVLVGDTVKTLPFTAREKVAVSEKVRFT